MESFVAALARTHTQTEAGVHSIKGLKRLNGGRGGGLRISI